MTNISTSMKINNDKNINYIPYGWVCPKCKDVMAPWQFCCIYCATAASCSKEIPCACTYTDKEQSSYKITTYTSSDNSDFINNSTNADKESLKSILKTNLQKYNT